MPKLVNFVMDLANLGKVDAAARLLGLSRSEFIRRAILKAAAETPAALVTSLDEREVELQTLRARVDERENHEA